MKNNIRLLRKARGLRQEDMARLLGVTRQTIIAIEQGKYSPTLEMAFRIDRVFKVPLDEVFHYPEGEASVSPYERSRRP